MYEKSEYTLYATVIDGNCIRIPIKFSYVAEGRNMNFMSLIAFSVDAKWSISSNSIWADQDGNLYTRGVNSSKEYESWCSLSSLWWK